jgi:integrase
MNLVDGEIKRIQNENISDDARNKILEFLRFIKEREELSDKRLYFYSNYLRLIARNMGNAFLNPTDKDIETAMAYQRSRTTQSGGKLSEWSIENYKATFRKFYTWMGKKDVVGWIKRNNRPNYKVKPDYSISQEEVDMLISACYNARDKAIFSILYDTGIRLGEMLTIRIKDIEFDDYGMRIIVTGKTGTRVVRATGDSVGFIRGWLNVHPDMFNEDAWLFCGLGTNMHGDSTAREPMDHDQVYRMFSKVKARAIKNGFPASKRINPHKFRHNRATHLASKVREPILEKQMGWIPSSRMTRVYVHLNDDEVDTAMLEANGIKVEKKQPDTRKSKACLSCKTPNPAKSKYCLQCGRPLDYSEAKIMDHVIEETAKGLAVSNLIPESEKSLLTALSPDAMGEVLLVYLRKLKQEGKLEELAKNL